MKTIISFFLAFLSFIVLHAQEFSLPFFDDFEETINDDVTFHNWTTENLEGWHYWHIIPWGGFESNQCMRFENNDIDQNDWLITKAINAGDADSLLIHFYSYYNFQGTKPKLLYTTEYTGDAENDIWTEIEYELGENMEQWHRSDDLKIKAPESTIWFAFHSNQKANEGVYFLFDNFSVKEYISAPTYELVGNTEHFEFYTNISEETDYWLEIQDELENAYLKYESIWMRPGFDPIFPSDHKLAVVLIANELFDQLNSDLPDWDCGSYNLSSGKIYLTPLKTEDQQNYYGNFSSLAVNELSQLALAGWSDFTPESYFSEGFGLYEMGYRPNRADLLDKLNELGTNEPSEELVKDISNIHERGNKDLLCSFIESKVLLHCYWYLYYTGAYKWHQLLKHYYIKDQDRIDLIYSTDNFDIYAAEKEIPFVSDMGENLEEQLALQEGRFDEQMNHRVNICIYDVEVGKEINNRTDFQGLACGADKINSVHLDIGDHGLMNHEFMHVWVNILSNHNPGPGQFLNEGLAESTDIFMSDEEMPWHRYKIDDLFYHYQRKYNREPTWLEIVDNTEVYEEDGFWVDSYALGEMYWSYLHDKYPENFWINVKLFLQNGRDWTVFGGKSAEQEGAEFIQFMKELAFAGPPLQAVSIPFAEDFKDEFTGWTRFRYGENDLWKIQDNWGYDDEMCAQITEPYWFEEGVEPNVDSWLISPPIDAGNYDDLEIEFMYSQHGSAAKPQIYFTNEFKGATYETNWIEVENLEWTAQEGQWTKMKFTLSEVPDKLYIGFRMVSAGSDVYTYNIDNFSVKEYIPAPTYELVGNTEHFEFYTNISEETDYWLEIQDELQNHFQKYCGIWNIEGKDDFIDKNIKTKIYYTEKTNIPFANETTPETKSGFFDRETKTIYLSPLNTPEKQEYYESMEGLAINTFAGYAKKHQLFRDDGYDGLPDYYTEGFGLYEQGFHPRLDSIISFRAKHMEDLTHEGLDAMNVFSGTSQKDIIVSYVEGQIVGLLDYWGTAPYSSHIMRWNKHLIHFYDTTDVVRIKKYASNENFDIYCSSRDTMFIDSFFVWLERPRQFYIDSFQIEVNRKFNLVIYYDEKTGMDMTGYDNWNGGAGGLNISPHNFPGGYDEYPWLLAHEFGHVYNSVIYPEMPVGFYHEGMANFSGYIQCNADWSESRWFIEWTLYQFHLKYGREPTLEEFINNPYLGTECDLNPYYYGLEFIRYLYELDGILKIKQFFIEDMNFNVFSKSYAEIETGYLKRLKLYRNLYPKDTLLQIPYQEQFADFSNGWTKPSYQNPDNWQIDDGGMDGNNCASFYTHSDKNEPIESWLISPALNVKNMNQINLSFDFARYGEGIELEVFYTDSFEGYTDSTEWTSAKSIDMPTDWNLSNTGEITINNPPDTLFIGLLMKSTGEQHLQLYIDNFEVDGAVTNSSLISVKKNNLNIHPNPATSESTISFQIQTSGNVNLSVFDIQGKKITTILQQNLPAGNYNYPLGKIIPTDGVYFLRLKTREGIATRKLIVN